AGFAAGVIAALVWNDDPEAGSGERFGLVTPGIPEFREAVEKEDHGAVGRAGADGVELARAVAKRQVFESGRHKSRVYPRTRDAGEADCERVAKAQEGGRYEEEANLKSG